MKKLALIISLACATLGASLSAHADGIDTSCFATLTQLDGSVAKASVDRRATVSLGDDNQLIVHFEAKYYGGGPAIPAWFSIKDANDPNPDDIMVFDTAIDQTWKWDFSQNTKYGIVHVICQ